MTRAARCFPQAERSHEPYVGFPNSYAGAATIARLVGPDTSDTMGCGIATYRGVRTTWRLPFDEIVYVLAGEMTVRAGAESWHVGVGDVLFFPRAEPIEYDVPGEVTVFYAKYPVGNSTPA
jgi:ethanolamine utilization protein EutQ